MKRFKNPYAGTMAAEFAKHCIVNRGMTESETKSRIVGLWDRLGPNGREKYLLRVHNILVARRTNRRGLLTK